MRRPQLFLLWLVLELVLVLVGAQEDVCEEDRISTEPSLLQSNSWKSSLVVSPSGEEVQEEKADLEEFPENQYSRIFESGGDLNDIPHYSLLEMNQRTRTHSMISAMQRAVSKRYLSYQAHAVHLRRSTNGLKKRLLEIAANAGAVAAAVEHAAAAEDADHPNGSGKAPLMLLSEGQQNRAPPYNVTVRQFFLPGKGKGKRTTEKGKGKRKIDAGKDEELDKLQDEKADKSQDGKVSTFEELVDRFIDSQSNSEDACHAQLLEAKHQLNSLRELVTDLVEEVNTTEKSMILYDKELQEKLQTLTDIQAWKDAQIKKCKVKKEEDAKMFVKLSEELKEMEQIASPDVSMNISAKTLHEDQEKAQPSIEASLLQMDSSFSLRHHAAQKLNTIPVLMNSTRKATLMYNRCMESRVRPSNADGIALLQGQNETQLTPEECKEQKIILEKTYVKTYVELARLKSQYEKLSKDNACEDTVQAEFAEQHDPLRESTEHLSKVSGETTKELNEIRPQLEKAEIAEGKLRIQVKRLTEQCGQLGTTVSDLDKVRDVIRALSDCPGLSRVEFLVPKWTGKWVSFMQDSDKNEDKEIDAKMDLSCNQTSPGSRAAEVGEIEERTIQDIPQKLSSGEPLLGACPNCEGEEDEMYKSGHARICWKQGASLDLQGESLKCGKGKKVILCVIDRGSIRSLPR